MNIDQQKMLKNLTNIEASIHRAFKQNDKNLLEEYKCLLDGIKLTLECMQNPDNDTSNLLEAVSLLINRIFIKGGHILDSKVFSEKKHTRKNESSEVVNHIDNAEIKGIL